MIPKFKHLFVFAACFLSYIVKAQNNVDQSKIRTLIVFFDGLRPDYITPEAMPNLYAFKKQGAYGAQHHSVFPTVTRVNASSYATGSYPSAHGIMGNSVYFPEVSKTKSLNTGEAADLNKINEATHGNLLTAISIGEILEQAGEKMMVFSSGSTGQALLQNHKISGGAVINPLMILPESIKEKVIQEVGLVPSGSKSNGHVWVTDALIKLGLAADGPLVSSIWFSDPDGTAHSDGIGAATSMASIKLVDEQFGRIIKTLQEKGLTSTFNIIISTDHGFVTYVGKEGLTEFLIKKGLKKEINSDDVVVAAGAVYVKDHDQKVIKNIVSALQEQEWAGAIFTKSKKAGDLKGAIDGTLSFESIHWNNSSRSGDILVDVNWDNRKNAAGYAGASFSKGVAGHGSSSPYEVKIPLIVSGPSFKSAIESNLPTSNVDIVPTILYLHHLKASPTMDGRVMRELLKENTTVALSAKTETIKTTVKQNWGSYNLTINRSIYDGKQYVNFTKVERDLKSSTK
ncbi:MAG: alkaline phosphatase family protein [Sphingobacteriales bacterium]|nr:alkaline phosphatase family protein [Sphingobacteriales bacterium]